MLTDPIADLLTKIRNAQMIRAQHVSVSYSRLKEAILKILQEEGYLLSFIINKSPAGKSLKISLKYDGLEPAIKNIIRLSKPGRRVYVKTKSIPRPLGGLGLIILSTPKGLLSGRMAKRIGVGGEVVCEVN